MLDHIPIALVIQLASMGIGRWLKVSPASSAWLGAFAGTAVCIAREVTQHEYRWIEEFGDGLRANMPWYEGFCFWDWNGHSIEETVVAGVASTLLATVVQVRANVSPAHRHVIDVGSH